MDLCNLWLKLRFSCIITVKENATNEDTKIKQNR